MAQRSPQHGKPGSTIQLSIPAESPESAAELTIYGYAVPRQWKPMNRSIATEKPANDAAPIAMPTGPPACTALLGSHASSRTQIVTSSMHDTYMHQEVRTAPSQDPAGQEACVQGVIHVMLAAVRLDNALYPSV